MLQTDVGEGEIFRKIKFFPRLLFDHRESFLTRLDLWIRKFDSYMVRKLNLDDFQVFTIDTETQNSYYSFCGHGYEICLDSDGLKWTVYLCNKFEEVLEEHSFGKVEEALDKANKLYWGFAPM